MGHFDKGHSRLISVVQGWIKLQIKGIDLNIRNYIASYKLDACVIDYNYTMQCYVVYSKHIR